MNTNQTRIVVVAAYSQRLGIAVFAHSDLLYFAVKTFKLPRIPESVRAETSSQIRNLIDEFEPRSLIIKKLSRRQVNSRNQLAVLEQVALEADLAGVPSVHVAFEDAKRDLSKEKGPTNSNTFHILKRIYPELKRFGQFQNRHQREYYVPMLTAVAIGRSHNSGL